MGNNPLCAPIFLCNVFCASEKETLEKLSETFVGARPFINRIMSVRAPLEEQHRSANFILGYMKKWDCDTVLKVQHHVTFSYKDDVLRKQLMKNVETLEGYHPNPKPLQVMQWNKNQLQQYLCYVERELSPMNVFNLVSSHMPTVTEPLHINAFEGDGVPGPSIFHLRSFDGQVIAVEVSAALKSNLIGNFLMDVESCPRLVKLDSCSPIMLPNVHSAILKRAVDFCKQQVAVETAISVQDHDRSFTEHNLSAFAAQLLNVDPETLVDIIWAADYMDMPVLLEFAFQKFAYLIKDASPEQIRELIDITCFYDAEEKEPLRWESMEPVDMDKLRENLKQQTSEWFCP